MRWPARLGAPGFVAMLALAAALLLELGVTPGWQAQARAEALARMQARQATPAATPAPAAMLLPAAAEPAERVADLLALALRHDIVVMRTQQQLQTQGAVRRLQLRLSARGHYADLRAFLAAALQADAALALDTLQLRRDDAGADTLGAELQWSLLQALPGTAVAAVPPQRPVWPAPPAAALIAWNGTPAPQPASAVATAAGTPASAAHPAFAYRWIGSLDDGAAAGAAALLAGPQRSLGVRAGDVLDGRWRVDSVAPARLQLTWLPTGEAVTVDAR